MSAPRDEPPEAYVYRRVAPPQFKIKRNEVDPEAFVPDLAMQGLSVFRADGASPYSVLQARLDDSKADLSSDNETVRARAQRFLNNNPDVETLVRQSQYRIVKIPIAEIERLGFRLEDPDEKGHLNILGERSQFEERKFDFTELIKSRRARILSESECLEK